MKTSEGDVMEDNAKSGYEFYRLLLINEQQIEDDFIAGRLDERKAEYFQRVKKLRDFANKFLHGTYAPLRAQQLLEFVR